MSADNIKVSGEIVEVCKAGMFKAKIAAGQEVKEIVCYLSGKIRQNGIRIVAGDSVEIELSPYDLSRGRIVYRNR